MTQLYNTDTFRQNLNLLFSHLDTFFSADNSSSMAQKIEKFNQNINDLQQNLSNIESRAILKKFKESEKYSELQYFNIEENHYSLPKISFSHSHYAQNILNNFSTLESSEKECKTLFNSFKLLNKEDEILIGTLFLAIDSTTSNILFEHLINPKLQLFSQHKMALFDEKINEIMNIEQLKNNNQGIFERNSISLNTIIMQSIVDKIENHFTKEELSVFQSIKEQKYQKEHNVTINQIAKNIKNQQVKSDAIKETLVQSLFKLDELFLENQNFIENIAPQNHEKKFKSTVSITPVKTIPIPEPKKIITFHNLKSKDKLKANLLEKIEKNKLKNKEKFLKNNIL